MNKILIINLNNDVKSSSGFKKSTFYLKFILSFKQYLKVLPSIKKNKSEYNKVLE